MAVDISPLRLETQKLSQAKEWVKEGAWTRRALWWDLGAERGVPGDLAGTCSSGGWEEKELEGGKKVEREIDEGDDDSAIFDQWVDIWKTTGYPDPTTPICIYITIMKKPQSIVGGTSRGRKDTTMERKLR